MDWINDELSELRIVVRNITEDLYDGQILAILMGMAVHILTFLILLGYCLTFEIPCVLPIHSPLFCVLPYFFAYKRSPNLRELTMGLSLSKK